MPRSMIRFAIVAVVAAMFLPIGFAQSQDSLNSDAIFSPSPNIGKTSSGEHKLRGPFKNLSGPEDAATAPAPESFFAYAPAHNPPTADASQKSVRASYGKKQQSEAEVDDFPHSNGWESASPPAQSQSTISDGTNGLMAPPFGGVIPIHRAYEERNPRPSYLKERKSAWLPDTLAAPADGIITPDWFERP